MEQKTANPREGLFLYEYYDGEQRASRAQLECKEIHLNGKICKAGLVGGVGTEPEYRRQGLVKRFLQAAAAQSLQEGAYISVLHPFSYDYYRKYGYERICDHKIVTLPMAAIPQVPRCNAFVRCLGKERNADLCGVYNTLAAGRNLMPRRSESYAFVTKDTRQKVYLSYNESGEADSYIICGVEKRFDVNRLADGVLNVYELGFTSPKALQKVFGFIRLFEGETPTVVLHNIAMLPEVELALRQYDQTEMRLVPDCMARIHHVKAVLEWLNYPLQQGGFTLRVQDPFPLAGQEALTCGAWQVQILGGKATVTPLPQEAAVDVSLDIPALSRFVFGQMPFGPQVAAFVPNLTVYNAHSDFFAAFAPKPCGMYEHF